jgi:hypothetical protein
MFSLAGILPLGLHREVTPFRRHTSLDAMKAVFTAAVLFASLASPAAFAGVRNDPNPMKPAGDAMTKPGKAPAKAQSGKAAPATQAAPAKPSGAAKPN